jgi:hypothetical protein
MKDAYFFPHYIGARNDNKIMRLRLKYGMEGYGIYFALLEVLREQSEHVYPLSDLDILSADIRVEQDVVESIISDFALFKKDKTNFWSPKLQEYLQPYYERKKHASNAGKKSAKVRNNEHSFNDRSTTVQPTLNTGSTINKVINKVIKEEAQFFSFFLSDYEKNPTDVVYPNTSFDNRKQMMWKMFEPLGYTKEQCKAYYERVHDRNWTNKDGDPYTVQMLVKEVLYYHKRGWLSKEGEHDTTE